MSAETWFSRLTLKREDASVAPLLQDLAPLDGGAAMATGHRLMWTLMPEATRAQFDRANPEQSRQTAFLWREAEVGRKFYLLGPRPARVSPYFEVESKPYDPAFRRGDRLIFNLRVNATVARKEAGRERSRRSDVAMDLMRKDEAAALAEGLDIAARADRRMSAAQAAIASWMERTGERDGFAVNALRLVAYRAQTLPRLGRSAKIGVSDIEGRLEVADGERFFARVLAGFGRAKAFGCGLMLLRRAE